MKPLTLLLMKSVILTTLKNEFDQLKNKYTDPFCSAVSMFELVSPHIIVDFEKSADSCAVMGDDTDLGDRIIDILVFHKDIEEIHLNASDLSEEMIIDLLEKAELGDFKNSLI